MELKVHRIVNMSPLRHEVIEKARSAWPRFSALVVEKTGATAAAIRQFSFDLCHSVRHFFLFAGKRNQHQGRNNQ
jgi:hypothetical protein